MSWRSILKAPCSYRALIALLPSIIFQRRTQREVISLLTCDLSTALNTESLSKDFTLFELLVQREGSVSHFRSCETVKVLFDHCLSDPFAVNTVNKHVAFGNMYGVNKPT